jgi:hypothetical protein
LEEKGSAVPKESMTQIQSKENVMDMDKVTHPSGIIDSRECKSCNISPAPAM